MKITGKASSSGAILHKTLNPLPDLDLSCRKDFGRNTHLKKGRVGAGAGPRLRKSGGGSVSRRSRPGTPLLKWKIEDGDKDEGVSVDGGESVSENCRRRCRKVKKGREVAVGSARKLAATLWRLQLPETGRDGDLQQNEDRLGFKPGVNHVGVPGRCHGNGKSYWCEGDLLRSPGPLSGTKNGFLYKNISSAMEGATKWDPVSLKTSDEAHQIHNHAKLDQQQISASAKSALEAELEQARAHIQELETERRSLKKKLEHFLRKVSEERAAWRSREHDKIRTFIEDIKAELNREKKNRQRIEFVNSKLVNELADAKLSAKRYMQDYAKERKARELIEDVCDELAKEIGENKAEIEAFKRDSMKLQEEVDDERKMLQMAEVWREERVQMKLVDAKVALEEKYSQMNKLVVDLGAFMRTRSESPDVKEMREAELLRQAAALVNIQEIREFHYEPPNPDDIFSVFEDVNVRETNEREIEPCAAYTPVTDASKIHTVSPEVSVINKNSAQRHSKAFVDQNDIEEDESGWETVSHLDDQGSSYSPEGSAPSVNKLCRDSNFSGSETDREEYAGEQTPITEISEVCSMPKRQSKVTSIVRLWKSCPNKEKKCKIISAEGLNASKLSNGRLSNVSLLSSDRGSVKGELSPSDTVEQWSFSNSGNPHITQAMKGLIQWPRGSQKNSLKAKLLEARIESQKPQLRHVLKHKI